MDDLFKLINEVQGNYRDGLIDKTDALALLTSHVVKETIDNASVNRNKAHDISEETGALEKIRQIVAQ